MITGFKTLRNVGPGHAGKPELGSYSTSSLRFRAYDFSHLSVGDIVEARWGGAFDHGGVVVKALPSLGLFWLRDSLTGAHRIIDFESFQIWYARPPR